MKAIFPAFLASLMLIASSESEARPGRWRDHDRGHASSGEVMPLGQFRVGNFGRGWDADTIDVYGSPRLQCNLTHIQLAALNDSVLLTRIEVEYRDADRFGANRDVIDLDDSDDSFGRRGRDHRRGGARGVYLSPGERTLWLDLDDVVDGFPNGRCVKSLTIFGVDTPDFGDRRRCPPGFPCRGMDAPATVLVDGFVKQRRMQPPPPHRRDRPLRFELLGTTGKVGKSKYKIREIPVGVSRGRFDGIKLVARDDVFDIRYAEVVFGNQTRARIENVTLQENGDVYFDFDNDDRFRRGGRDQDRFIDRVIVYGGAGNIFGSKAQLEVWGGR